LKQGGDILLTVLPHANAMGLNEQDYGRHEVRPFSCGDAERGWLGLVQHSLRNAEVSTYAT